MFFRYGWNSVKMFTKIYRMIASFVKIAAVKAVLNSVNRFLLVLSIFTVRSVQFGTKHLYIIFWTSVDFAKITRRKGHTCITDACTVKPYHILKIQNALVDCVLCHHLQYSTVKMAVAHDQCTVHAMNCAHPVIFSRHFRAMKPERTSASTTI